MKYTIEGFNQMEALKFRDVVDGKQIQIDVTDLSILRWLVDFYPKMPKTEIEGTQYVWISYKALLNDIPLLDIKKVALANRLKKMVHFGILNFKLLTNGNTYTYYSFGNNYEKLISTPNNKNATPCHSNDNPLPVECQPPCHSNDNHNNSSINNSSINKSITHKSATKVACVRDFDLSMFDDEEIEAIERWVNFRTKTYKLKKSHQSLKVIINEMSLAKNNNHDIINIIDYFINHTTWQNINTANINAMIKKQGVTVNDNHSNNSDESVSEGTLQIMREYIERNGLMDKMRERSK